MDPDLYDSGSHTIRTILCSHRTSQKCHKIASREINRIVVKKKKRHVWVLCSAEWTSLLDVLSLAKMLRKQDGISFKGERQSGRRQETWLFKWRTSNLNLTLLLHPRDVDATGTLGTRLWSREAFAPTEPRGLNGMRWLILKWQLPSPVVKESKIITEGLGSSLSSAT